MDLDTTYYAERTIKYKVPIRTLSVLSAKSGICPSVSGRGRIRSGDSCSLSTALPIPIGTECASMLAKKLVIVIALAFLALGIGYISTEDYVNAGPAGSYDYDVTYAEYFLTEEGLIATPDIGKTFAIVDVVVRNDSFSKGIDTNILILAWTLFLDRTEHEPDAVNTAFHPGYERLTIGEGRTWGYSVVFQVAHDSVGKRDLSLGYHYTSLSDDLNLEYDPELRLEIGRSVSIGPAADVRPQPGG